MHTADIISIQLWLNGKRIYTHHITKGGLDRYWTGTSWVITDWFSIDDNITDLSLVHNATGNELVFNSIGNVTYEGNSYCRFISEIGVESVGGRKVVLDIKRNERTKR